MHSNADIITAAAAAAGCQHRGVGCVPIHNLMEDAATAEISRSQLWQWVRHGARTAEGTTITAPWVAQLLEEETQAFRR